MLEDYKIINQIKYITQVHIYYDLMRKKLIRQLIRLLIVI